MNLPDFTNHLRVLLSIDLDELQQVGLMFRASPSEDNPAWREWRTFRADPFRYLIKTDDDTARKIWSVVQVRLDAAPTDGWRSLGSVAGSIVKRIGEKTA